MKFINASRLDSKSIYTISCFLSTSLVNVLLMMNAFSFECHNVSDNIASAYKH